MTAKTPLSRAPLTTEQLERLTADDFARIKLTDEEECRLLSINEARERQRRARAARVRAEQAQIVDELLSAGVEVSALSDLIMRRSPYPAAVPILLKHLVLPYSDVTIETIARALAVPDARCAWTTLVAEYRKRPAGIGIKAPGETEEFRLGAKDGLAAAISATATDDTMEELIALAKDPSLGDSRLLLLRGIMKSRGPLAKRAIKELAFDPALAKEIASRSKRRKRR